MLLKNFPELIRDDKAKTLSYFFKEDCAQISPDIISMLVRESEANNECDARICLHTRSESNFHEMLIIQHAGRYYRPHKHLDKGESHHIIEGKAASIIFSECGEVEDCRILSKKGGVLIDRVGANQWHTVWPISDRVIYHEAKPGPYLHKGDSIFPSWAPDGIRVAPDATVFMKTVLTKVS